MAFRSTLSTLVSKVRGLTGADVDEYSIGVDVYFSDSHIADYLDRHRIDLRFQLLSPEPVMAAGGSLSYYDYRAPYGNLESTLGGTSVFVVQDALGTTIGIADYSADYVRGAVTFTSDTGGSARYLTARSYNIYEAAADLLDDWAANVKLSFDFSEDGQSFKLSQKLQGLQSLAKHYRGQAGVSSVQLVRGDFHAD